MEFDKLRRRRDGLKRRMTRLFKDLDASMCEPGSRIDVKMTLDSISTLLERCQEAQDAMDFEREVRSARGRGERYLEMNAKPVETKKSSSNLPSAKLPTWSIPKFTDKVLRFPSFWEQFNAGLGSAWRCDEIHIPIYRTADCKRSHNSKNGITPNSQAKQIYCDVYCVSRLCDTQEENPPVIWEHVKDLNFADDFPRDRCEFDVLIRMDYYYHFIEDDGRTVDDGCLVIVKSTLGWILWSQDSRTSCTNTVKLESIIIMDQPVVESPIERIVTINRERLSSHKTRDWELRRSRREDMVPFSPRSTQNGQEIISRTYIIYMDRQMEIISRAEARYKATALTVSVIKENKRLDPSRFSKFERLYKSYLKQKTSDCWPFQGKPLRCNEWLRKRSNRRRRATDSVLPNRSTCKQPTCAFIVDDPGDPNPLTPFHFLIGRGFRNVYKIYDGEDDDLTYPEPQSQMNCPDAGEPRIRGIVLVAEDGVPTHKWPMARLAKVYPGGDGVIRTVRVKKLKGTYNRPARFHELAVDSDGLRPSQGVYVTDNKN
ncbi:hypothetical protein T4D_858 [Trichinella pseudospiralis]|uniref:DUF5641 domain-containing protein n=1 Tax=Trichinella pseudospiralis TaxID=6337 RepID=A0A0V1FIW9_TRIPS|nr:hypothetical protein T4D_858 [Trichinella pseudospiralis]